MTHDNDTPRGIAPDEAGSETTPHPFRMELDYDRCAETGNDGTEWVDEIAGDGPFHIEMLSENTAHVYVMDHRFMMFAKRGKLWFRFDGSDEPVAALNQPAVPARDSAQGRTPRRNDPSTPALLGRFVESYVEAVTATVDLATPYRRCDQAVDALEARGIPRRELQVLGMIAAALRESRAALAEARDKHSWTTDVIVQIDGKFARCRTELTAERARTEKAEDFANRWMKAAMYVVGAADLTLAFDPTSPESFAESRRRAIDALMARAEKAEAERDAALARLAAVSRGKSPAPANPSPVEVMPNRPEQRGQPRTPLSGVSADMTWPVDDRGPSSAGAPIADEATS